MNELGFTRARYAASDSNVINEILADLRPGDLVLTIGAGSVWKIAAALARAASALAGAQDAKLARGTAIVRALLAEGGQLDDPAAFVKRVNRLLLEG